MSDADRLDSDIIRLSIDGELTSILRNYRCFLKKIFAIESLKRDDSVIRNAVRRYETIWLRLLKEEGDRSKEINPPLDVEWIWTVHMTYPKEYRSDCKNLIGFVPDHTIRDPNDNSLARKKGEKLWKEFTAGDEPYETDLSRAPPINSTNQTALSVDLLECAKRQADFYYDISLPHFGDKIFLQNAQERYKLFSKLTARLGRYLFAPTDIRFVCKCHMLHPHSFNKDTDVWGAQHIDLEKMELADKQFSINAWKEMIGSSLFAPGSLSRGPSPENRLDQVDISDIHQSAGRITVRVTIVAAKLTIGHKVNKAKIKIFEMEEKEGDEKDIKHKKEKGRTVWNSHQTKIRDDSMFVLNGANKFQLTINPPHVLKVNVEVNQGGIKSVKSFFKPKMYQFDGFLIVDAARAFIEHNKAELSVKLDSGNSPNVFLELALRFSRPYLSDLVFNLVQGNFTTKEMPQTEESLWGPVPLASLPEDVKHNCAVANHVLYPDSAPDERPFHITVIHSLLLKTSAIQVFAKRRLVCVAHTVGNDQLPTSSLVSDTKKIPSLDVAKGERAILIKDKNGDWAIIKGIWQDKNKRTPSHLKLIIYYVRNDPSDADEYTAFDRKTNVLRMKTVNVSLQTGRIRAQPEGTPGRDKTIDVAPSIAFAFTVAVLCTLCEPRPQQLRQKDISKTDSTDGIGRGNTFADDLVRGLRDEHKPTFVDSGGFLETVASNAMLFLAAKGLMNVLGGGPRRNRRRSSSLSLTRREEEERDAAEIEERMLYGTGYEEDEPNFDNLTNYYSGMNEDVATDVFCPWGETGDDFVQAIEAGQDLDDALNNLDINGYHDEPDMDPLTDAYYGGNEEYVEEELGRNYEENEENHDGHDHNDYTTEEANWSHDDTGDTADIVEIDRGSVGGGSVGGHSVGMDD
ncbi:unnamed protein product [Dimorphilus gyrociliatus]|uniref:Uncharacterized protein n=1 Tax=Dimorphilus gyrociliatus TaxID=2664684 RepID=A0A7I8W5Z7_9ANNE|nr:unnamed protein product [Dimorphilus gyrociliatus]